jgi:hypothetical protein
VKNFRKRAVTTAAVGGALTMSVGMPAGPAQAADNAFDFQNSS